MMEELGNHIAQATGAAASVRLGELMLESTPDKLLEQAARVVTQEGEQRDQAFRPGVEHQLAQTHIGCHHGALVRLRDVLAEFLEQVGHRTIVPVLRTFFWSCSTP